MKIRTQFMINIIVLGSILLIVTAAVIVTNQWVEDTHQQQELAAQIEHDVYELGYLANDYLLYRESQQASRWESKFASFSDHLSQAQGNTPEQQALLADIRSSQRQLKGVFEEVKAQIESAPQTPESGFDSKFMQLSWSRLEVQNQGMIFDASQLQRLLNAQEHSLERLARLLGLASIGILAVFLLVNYGLTFRRTLRSIAKLQDGTRIIGSGNLDFAIDVKNEDEIGELSHAFNRMTGQLKMITASRAELEREIGERKQAEQALRESEAHYRGLIESQLDLIVRVDPEGHFTFVNDAYCQKFGLKREEILGQASFQPLVHPEDLPHTLEAMKALYVPPYRVVVEQRAFAVEGVRWLEWQDSVIRDESGQVVEIQAIGRDITDRKRAQEALRKSEQKFSVIFEKSAFAGALARLPNGVIVNINEEFERVFEYTKEEVIGRTSLELGINPDSEERARLTAELQARGSVREQEVTLVTKSGVPRVFLLNLDLVEIGEEKYILQTTQDITERKQAEDGLRRFELLSNHSRDIILFMRREDGRILEANTAAAQAYGYSREEMLGLSIRDLRAPDTLGLTAEQMAQADAGGILFETSHRRKDGRTFPVEVSSQGATIGGVRTLISIVRDITERKEAEEARREKEAEIRSLYESMAELFVLHEITQDASGKAMDYRILECNRAFEEVTGIQRDAAVGNLASIVYGTGEAPYLDIYAPVAETGAPIEFETEFAPMGKHFHISVFSPERGRFATLTSDITARKQAEAEIASLAKFPTENPNPILRVQNDGKVTYANAASQELLEVWGCHVEEYLPEELRDFVTVAVDDQLNKTVDVLCKDKVYSIMLAPIVEGGYVNIYGRDVTERKRAEEALKRITEDLRRSNAELEQFAYVASHDLQEPLRMVSSYMQLLKRRYQGRLDSDADEFIHYAVDGATRMQNLINDLLAFSRVGTRGRPMGLSSCEKVLEEALLNLQVAIEESEAVISHDPLPAVFCDQPQLVQVFQNLIGNSLKFRGQQAPHIHISAQRAESEWVFSFCDNGIGLDPKFGERIFDIFQRLHSRTAYPGTGIGLAICKRIVQRHGGRIWVKSKPGEGATFYFTLPAKENT